MEAIRQGIYSPGKTAFKLTVAMNLSSALAVDSQESRGPLHEDEGVAECPLCKYQDESIIAKLNDMHRRLVDRISEAELYAIIVSTYEKEIEPLRRQGRCLLELTVEQCRLHFDKHVINPSKSIIDDINFCERIQRHIRDNVALHNKRTGHTNINKAYTKEWVTISKHKLDLIRYYSLHRRRQQESKSSGNQVASSDVYNFT